MLFGKAKHRRFQFQPRYYQEGQDEERRIRFRRITTYDPHDRRRMRWLIFLVLLVGLMIYLFAPTIFPYLGGVQEVTIDVIDIPAQQVPN